MTSMLVKELIEKLKKMPQDNDIGVRGGDLKITHDIISISLEPIDDYQEVILHLR